MQQCFCLEGQLPRLLGHYACLFDLVRDLLDPMGHAVAVGLSTFRVALVWPLDETRRHLLLPTKEEPLCGGGARFPIGIRNDQKAVQSNGGARGMDRGTK